MDLSNTMRPLLKLDSSEVLSATMTASMNWMEKEMTLYAFSQVIQSFTHTVQEAEHTILNFWTNTN
ncbi:hypothetical protein DV702_12400 [Sporosarcina sp. PTS2304]|nr:hypothetical protein DV702_12400 [Sporosarcina sp. PTS2304]